MNPEFSIVVPAYNRVDRLRATLRNLAASLEGIRGEIVVVDDGSDPPLEPDVAALGLPCVRVVRRENAGSAVARHAAIMEARGEFLLVSDSDDFVHPDKPRLHMEAMRREASDVSYCDEAFVALDGVPAESNVPRIVPSRPLRRARSLVDLLFLIQPMSNNIVYRTAWIREALRDPLVPARPEHGPAGDLWIFHNLVVRAGRVSKVDAVLSYHLRHDGDRYQAHWEKLGASSLLLSEEFALRCPATPETAEARTAKAIVMFRSWRTLPNDFDPEYEDRTLAVYRALPRPPLSELGGVGFRLLARALGPVRAGRLLRRRQRPSYDAVRTMSNEELAALIRELPPRPRYAES